MEALLSRPVVVMLALLGAGFSLAASLLQKRGVVTERGARRLNLLGYACMGASMAFFVAAGLRGVQGQRGAAVDPRQPVTARESSMAWRSGASADLTVSYAEVMPVSRAAAPPAARAAPPPPPWA